MAATKLIKIALAILLLLCLLKMPYGYYQLVRFIALVGFGFLAYQAHQKENLTTAFIYVALPYYSNPFLRLHSGGRYGILWMWW